MKLYKYTKWCCYSKEAINNHTAWFASPDSLNDPFDCILLFKIGKNRDQEIIREFNDDQPTFPLPFHLNFSPGLANDQNVSIFRWFNSKRGDFDQFLKTKHQDIWGKISELDKVRNRLGVASFAKIANNPLLWAYYAEDHKGVCIEYEMNDVSSLKKQEVEYVERVSEIKFNIELDSWKADKVNSLFFKSKEWSHEGEFRLIDLNQNQYSHKIPISRVICGFKMSEDQYEEVRAYCRNIDVVKVNRFEGFAPLIPRQ